MLLYRVFFRLRDTLLCKIRWSNGAFVLSTQVSLVSPGFRGNVPALRGDVHETSGEGTEVVLDRQKVSLCSTELRLEGTKDRLKATERRFAGPEIARASPDVFLASGWCVALFSTGFVSDRTNFRGDATQRLYLAVSCQPSAFGLYRTFNDYS